MTIRDTARNFFDACETGKGWDGCRQYCHDNATFAAQADIVDGIDTLADYTDWLASMFVPCPDGHYELTGFAVDEDRQKVIGTGIFKATHTVDAGNGPPTGKSVAADYAYIMEFDGDKICHMTKIWNDGHSLRQLGWAE
ncbi:ester cyclase [Sphingomicrobium clamense]|uniref:Nuclear transport factor 2 family protein n=1 Tax=Sphingomicrobium clamense TaxID=2851013 RepID=A0ABS6V2K1_9SPHN|nr:nuclear transport factor 2 family protein [Sphingomicrobium sp. B8]MBW0143769.1 nuclear transport factor 2 family protein [Sphingomicrobium sp. B8]